MKKSLSIKHISKKRLIEVYDEEAKVYDVKRKFYEYGYAGMRERKLLSFFCRGPRVLNIACGTGRLLYFFAMYGFEVVGIDLSKSMLNFAKKKTITYKNVHLIRADAEFLPFRNGAFEEIVCSRAFKFFPNALKAINEGSRVLKKRGKYIFSLETSDPLWIRIGFKLNFPHMGHPFEHRYRVKDVCSLLKEGKFQIIFTGCIIYFGKPVYEVAEKFFRPLLKFLERIDSHCKTGRNVLFVGIKK